MEVRKAKVLSLTLGEGKVYGARYHTVTPEFGANWATWFKMEWDEMVAWCVDTYGPSPKQGVFEPGGRWYTNNAKFWFRNECDRDFFILKWK